MALKKPTYQVVVHNDDENSFDYVIQVFQSVLGQEMTQAANCANMVHHKGSYVVKTVKDKEIAETFEELLLDHGLNVEIRTFSKK
jgi:ATP-dependent Clp protease adaptor protein ClpS